MGVIVQVCSSRNRASPLEPTIGVRVITQVSTIGPAELFPIGFVRVIGDVSNYGTHVSTVLVVLKVVGPSVRTLGVFTDESEALPTIGNADPKDEAIDDSWTVKRNNVDGLSIVKAGAGVRIRDEYK